MYTLTVISNWLAAAQPLLQSCLYMIAKEVKKFGPPPGGHNPTSYRHQIPGPTFLFLKASNSKRLHELCTSCTYFVDAPCWFTNSPHSNKCVFCLRQFTVEHFAPQYNLAVYTSFAWLQRVIIISNIIIIGVKHNSIIGDTGDDGYWSYRCNNSQPCP